jgi:hypothetical protein
MKNILLLIIASIFIFSCSKDASITNQKDLILGVWKGELLYRKMKNDSLVYEVNKKINIDITKNKATYITPNSESVYDWFLNLGQNKFALIDPKDFNDFTEYDILKFSENEFVFKYEVFYTDSTNNITTYSLIK